ncbi:MAG: hypothetical protein U9N45_02485, partial [Gemmatimonadota bacterium]|nr:hypothetical protein [Gemmatimonadota bacterium]
RTETVAGDEAFGAHHHHVMGRLFATRCDTTVEMHYMAPIGDRVLLKAKETVSNETGGFIPMGVSGGSGPRVGKRVKVGGVTKVIPLNRLARMLLDPAGWNMPLSGVEGPALASDGVQNRDGVIFYNQDFIFVYNELYKGRRWVSEEAPEAGGIEVSQKVTNILDGLEEFEGPIAEVELTNTFIESTGSENTKIRYYYKGGVGVVQAEIYETNILIVIELEDGTWEVLGIGTWSTVKKLVSYTVK